MAQRAQIQTEGVDLLNRARELILSAQNFNINLPWKDAAINMVNMANLKEPNSLG